MWETRNKVWRVAQVTGQLAGILVCTTVSRSYSFAVDDDGEVEIRNSRDQRATDQIPGYVLARISATAHGGLKPLHKKMAANDPS
ncbi:hypothetical protein [Tumebacillus permanentifrigoris]|uniref:Uncharacterized protein n=1 Tax=Tumebacillus permanentifrigoris TaxID=378543 RepID=A0A316DDF5_9BACL|nr:hypothetical protein [Tumebacillus permanentifrigoris]PWK16044.1 hypothetical protein C7459_102291 [Tumebacillus permanentifrigoris]